MQGEQAQATSKIVREKCCHHVDSSCSDTSTALCEIRSDASDGAAPRISTPGEAPSLVSLNLEFCGAASILGRPPRSAPQHPTRSGVHYPHPEPPRYIKAHKLKWRPGRGPIHGLFRDYFGRAAPDGLALGLFRRVRATATRSATRPRCCPSSPDPSTGRSRARCVSGCSLISDAGIKALVEHAPHLHFLDVTRCPELTGAAPRRALRVR